MIYESENLFNGMFNFLIINFSAKSEKRGTFMLSNFKHNFNLYYYLKAKMKIKIADKQNYVTIS